MTAGAHLQSHGGLWHPTCLGMTWWCPRTRLSPAKSHPSSMKCSRLARMPRSEADGQPQCTRSCCSALAQGHTSPCSPIWASLPTPSHSTGLCPAKASGALKVCRFQIGQRAWDRDSNARAQPQGHTAQATCSSSSQKRRRGGTAELCLSRSLNQHTSRQAF